MKKQIILGLTMSLGLVTFSSQTALAAENTTTNESAQTQQLTNSNDSTQLPTRPATQTPLQATQPLQTQAVAAPIKVTTDNFPDPNLLIRMRSYDADKNGELSDAEIKSITSLYLNHVNDLTGIKLLTSLTDLTIANSKTTKIDLRGMASLQKIEYSDNNTNLTELDLRDCPNLVSAHHSVHNETVYISAGMTKYVGCEAINEHTGHIVIDLRGIATVNPDGSKQVDLTKIISPTLISVFKEHQQPGFDATTNILTIPADQESSDYVAGEDIDGKDTNWTFYTDLDHPAGGDVTVKYVDENGDPLTDDVVLTGKVGNQYGTKQKDFPGYTFKEVQGQPQGTFIKDSQTITYVYTKDEVKPAPIVPQQPITPDPTPTPTPSVPTPAPTPAPDTTTEQPKSNTNNQPAASTQTPAKPATPVDNETTSQNNLPKTGDQVGWILASLGALILGLASFLVFWERKAR